MSNIHDKIKLAKMFGQVLQGWLSLHQMRAIIDRNNSRDDMTCATHDFCDANVAMVEAYCKVTGKTEDDIDLQDHETSELLNDAWAIAKSADFYI